MRVVLYDLPDTPFSQGYALVEIHRATGGRVLLAGDCMGGPVADGHGLIYVKQQYASGEIVESIWDDDGRGVICLFKRTNNKKWQRRIEAGEWEPAEVSLDFFRINPAAPLGERLVPVTAV